MFSTNHPYDRSRQNTTYGTNNNPLSNSRHNNNFNQGPQRENLGSYRVTNYRNDEMPSPAIMSVVPQWKQDTVPNSIATKEKVLHLSITQLRVEDYYMIRTKKLQEKQAKALQICINSQCFNGELLNNVCYKLFPFSHDRPIDLDNLRHQPYSAYRGNSSSFTSNSNTNSNSNSSNQGYSNVFNRDNNAQTNNHTSSIQSSGNIFSRNNNSNSSGSNNNTLLNSSNRNSINNNGSIQGGNIFNGQPGSTFTNNANNSNSSNRGITNSITSNNNVTNGNNNNNNSGTSSNIFSNFAGGTNSNSLQRNNSADGSNGNQNSGNFLNNSNKSNPFNQSSNNTSSNTSGNTSNNPIFANNSANINNLFGNKQQNGNQTQPQTSTNNIFNQNYTNTNQNSNNFSFNNQQPNNQPNPSLFANSNQFNPNQGQPFNSVDMLNSNTFDFFNAHAVFFNGIMKQIEQRAIQKISPFQEQRRQSYPGYNQFNEQSHYSREFQLYQQPFFPMLPSKSRYVEQAIKVAVIAQKKHKQIPSNSQIYPQYKHVKGQKSNLNESNLLPLHSRITNQDERFKSIRIEQNSQVKKCKSLLFRNGPQICSVRLQVKWMDKLKEKAVQKTTIVKDRMQFPHIDLGSESGLELFVLSLKEVFPIIRGDAKFIVNQNQSEAHSDQIMIVGTIEQFIINLDPKQYQFSYNAIRNGHIYDFTIMKVKNGIKTATISWDAPIKYEALDFSAQSFNLQLSQVICDIPALNSRCRITFEALPQRIGRIFKSIGKVAAAANLKSLIEGKNESEKQFQFCSIYDDGSWTFIVQKFN